MDDDVDRRTVLTEEDKEEQMIARITAAVIAAMKAINLTSSSAASAAAPAEVNAGSKKQFKPEEIGFFDPELGLGRRSCNEACYKDNRKPH
jgi:hypothetical protein